MFDCLKEYWEKYDHVHPDDKVFIENNLTKCEGRIILTRGGNLSKPREIKTILGIDSRAFAC